MTDGLPPDAATPAAGLPDTSASERRAATDLDPAEWAAYVAEAGEPAYRARQIRHHLFRRHTATFAGMVQLPAALRERLQGDLTPYGLAERSRTRSRDGLTNKLLLQAVDGHTVEAVSIREPLPPDPRRVRRARHTVCVSSQVGCAMGCIFCASGIGGVERNLTAGEMLDQVATVQREFGPLTNLVFMGMGEPLANYPALSRALAVLCDRDGFGFSARRITVSTVGLVSGIERLAGSGLPVGLAVSLHAADDALRRRLVPTAGRWPVAEIIAAAAAYAHATGRTVTFEYVLLAGINDAVTDAERLADLLRTAAAGAPAKVNAIPYNPVPEFAHLRRPSAARVHTFVQTLRRRAVPVTVRKEKGHEVAAACGQLRRHATAPSIDNTVAPRFAASRSVASARPERSCRPRDSRRDRRWFGHAHGVLSSKYLLQARKLRVERTHLRGELHEPADRLQEVPGEDVEWGPAGNPRGATRAGEAGRGPDRTGSRPALLSRPDRSVRGAHPRAQPRSAGVLKRSAPTVGGRSASPGSASRVCRSGFGSEALTAAYCVEALIRPARKDGEVQRAGKRASGHVGYRP